MKGAWEAENPPPDPPVLSLYSGWMTGMGTWQAGRQAERQRQRQTDKLPPPTIKKARKLLLLCIHGLSIFEF